MATGGLKITDVVAKNASHKDLSDMMVYLERDTYPLVTMLPKTSQSNDNLLSEWPVNRHLNPVQTASGDGEVEEFDTPFENYGLLRNRLQWNVLSVAVSRRSQGSQNLAGISGATMWAKAVKEKMVQAKRSWECQIGSDMPVKEGNGTKENPDWSRGIGAYIANTSVDPTGYQIPEIHRTPATSIYSGAALSALDETGASNSLNALSGSIYDEVKDKESRQLLCGRLLKAHISTWLKEADSTNAVVRQFNANSSEKTLLSVVNVIENDTLTLEARLSPWLAYFDTQGRVIGSEGATNTTTTAGLRGYIISPKQWALKMKHNPGLWEEPETFGGKKGVIWWEYTLECYAPRGEGKIDPSGA